jgi:hypothetical protein
MYVVAFNTNTGPKKSWFAAINKSDQQVMSKTTADRVQRSLTKGKSNIKAVVIPADHPRVYINKRTKYVQVGDMTSAWEEAHLPA